MNVDTNAIRRLRDHLLDASSAPRPAQGVEQKPLSAAVLRRVEPFAETMFLVMSADDDAATAEQDAIAAALAALTDRSLPTGAVSELMDKFRANLRREGREGRLARIGAWLSRDRDDRETAFALAAAVAIADQRIELEENQTLEWVREYYGLSQRQARALLEADD